MINFTRILATSIFVFSFASVFSQTTVTLNSAEDTYIKIAYNCPGGKTKFSTRYM